MKFSSSALVICMIPRSAAFTNGLKQASKKIFNRIPIAMVSAEAATSPIISSANPLLDQDGLPKFASIEPSNLTPAVTTLLEKMEKDFASFEEKISKEEFEKKYETLLPELEKMQFPLGYVWGVAGHLNGVKNTDELRKAYEENQPKIVTSFSKFSQSKPLYDAMTVVEQSWENDASSAEDDFYLAQQKRAVKNSLRSMKLGGVGLEGADKERFNAIKLRLAELSTTFSNNVLDSTKAFHLDLTDPADVDGVPSSNRAMWASNYKAGMKKEHDKDVEATADSGPWRIGLDAPSYIAAMQHIPSREVREKVYKAFLTRASEFTKTDDDKSKDNVPLIYEILKLKMERAKLLGFNSPAEMSLASKMAPSVESVLELSEMILEKALPAALRELDEITALARANGGDEYSEEKMEKLMPWDTTYWSERLKESKFDMKEEELRPYFALPNVLSGMFGLVERIFNIEVKSADGEAEVWNPDVQFFNVYDKESGKHIASFFLDPYSRPADKRGGAWMDTCIGKSEAVKRDVPVAYLTCNGSPPVDGTPSLMTFREVETLFHEFGHGLQHMLTRATVGDVAGISGVEWDAVELPSQFMENWCYDKKTVYGFAKHYETGEPLPEEMFAKLHEQKTFGAGMMACRQLLFGMLDMELHANFDAAEAENGGESIFDVHRRLAEKCTPYALPLKEDRFLCSFNHIFAGGYSAGYYSYKWAEVMSADAFGAFEEVGLENEEKVQETGRRFRDTVLSLGGGVEPMEVFKRFRGREPSPEALLRHNGLA
jgi:oligopeptidase A